MPAMLRTRVPQLAATHSLTKSSIRSLATVSPVQTATRQHEIVVIGGGSAGIALSHQLLRKANLSQDDIAIVDPAQWHNYQPGWTLVGGGLKKKEDLRRPMKDLMNPKFKFYNTAVGSLHPEENYITTTNGDKLSYEQLVVVPGITLDYASVSGLKEALEEKDSMVSTIYDYAYCDKAFSNVQKFKKGGAVFTQPAGVVKCAGAPQKIMWLALDYWKNAGLYNPTSSSPINIAFATGLPKMFGVDKYVENHQYYPYMSFANASTTGTAKRWKNCASSAASTASSSTIWPPSQATQLHLTWPTKRTPSSGTLTFCT